MSTEDPSADEVTPYNDCEANTVHISIDVHDNDSGYTTPAVKGKNMQATRSLITLATCAIQFAHATRNRDPNPDRLNCLSRAINFSEIRKLSGSSTNCMALCTSPSDAFTLIATGNIIIPFARSSISVSFFSARDAAADSLITSEGVVAQLNFREHFYQGGLSLIARSPVSLPPDMFFRMVLLTLCYYKQIKGPPTSMGTDDGAAPYLQDLLEVTPQDPKHGLRNAPWLTPTVADHNVPLT